MDERPTLGSLFSGIGGFDLAYERAGFRVAWQVEIEPNARRVLEAHFPDAERAEDVTRVHGVGYASDTGRLYRRSRKSGFSDPCGGNRRDAVGRIVRGGASDLLPTVDVLCGGFPCQDLSVAGKRAGLAGERSGLWHEFHRLIAELRPRWVVIENVPGLLSSNSGADLAVVLGGLAELGYWWAYRVLDAQHFGVAQRRRRVFIVASSRSATDPVKVLFEPESCGGNPPSRREAGQGVAGTLGSSAGKRGWNNDLDGSGAFIPAVGGTLGGGSGERGWPQDTDRMTFPPAAIGTLSPGAHPGGANGQDAYTGQLIPSVAPMLGGGNYGQGNLDEGVPMMVAQSVSLRGRDGGATAELGGDVATAMRASQGGGDKPHALTEMEVRRLTPTECERLQGFPDGWTLPAGSDSGRYRALGNAVAVPVVEWVARRMLEVHNG